MLPDFRPRNKAHAMAGAGLEAGPGISTASLLPIYLAVSLLKPK